MQSTRRHCGRLAESLPAAALQVEFGGTPFFNDPYPSYAQLRAAEVPVLETASRSWLIARYPDVEALLRDARVSKNFQRTEPTPFDKSVLFQDAPSHARVRGVLNQAFSGSAAHGLENRVGKIADDLIDAMRPNTRLDFIASFARQLPVLVMTSLLGVPKKDVGPLRRLSGEFIAEDTWSLHESRRRQGIAIHSMAEYFGGLIASLRNQASGDILGVLKQAHSEGGLSHDEMIGNCILLMVAGHETTVNLLGNGLYLLLTHPEQLKTLQRQSELWPGAIEEILRYESPVQLGTFRVTTEPLTISGATLEAGSNVTAVIGSANRDPVQFPEPDRFDVTRKPNRHLAFGMGAHFCLGASLARTEALVGFQRLFHRFPDLALAPGDLVTRSRVMRLLPWRRNAVTRGLTELMLKL